MVQSDDTYRMVRGAAARKVLFLSHAVRQMSKPERMISRAEVREVIDNGTIIEDYPGDVRGHSCLLLGFGHDGRAIHVVCAPKEEYLAVITAYLPGENQWENDFTTRKKQKES